MLCCFFFSSRRRHTRCALVTGGQTCALPISTALAISRPPGRPSASEPERASRASIFRAGLELTKSVPLQDLSIVGLARSMDITPALVHYYVGSRDHLTSGIMNLFYKGTVKNWPAQTGDWQQDEIGRAHV